MWSVKSKIFTLWTLTENICLTGATSSSDSRSSLASPRLQPHWTSCMLFSRRESVISCLCVWYSLWSVSQTSFTFSWLTPTYSLIVTSALSSSRKPSLNNCLRHTDQAESDFLSSVLHHCLCIPPILQLTSYYFSHIGHTSFFVCLIIFDWVPDTITVTLWGMDIFVWLCSERHFSYLKGVWHFWLLVLNFVKLEKSSF